MYYIQGFLLAFKSVLSMYLFVIGSLLLVCVFVHLNMEAGPSPLLLIGCYAEHG